MMRKFAKDIARKIYWRSAHLGAQRLLRSGRNMPVTVGANPTVGLIVIAGETTKSSLQKTLSAHGAMPKGSSQLIILNDDSSQLPKDLGGDITVIETSGESHVEKLRSAVNAADSDFITYLEGGKHICAGGLKSLISPLKDDENINLLYWDGYDTQRTQPLDLKPAWDPVLLCERDYIGTDFCLRASQWKDDDFWSEAHSGGECYALLLRMKDRLHSNSIAHYPNPVTTLNAEVSDRKTDIDLQQKAKLAGLEAYLARTSPDARAEAAPEPDVFTVSYKEADAEWPRINVIIPNRDQPELMTRLLGQLQDFTDYPNMTVTVVDNDTTDEQTLSLYDRHIAGSLGLKVVFAEGAFNFSRSINIGLAEQTSGHHLLLNNDVEILDQSWLKELVNCLAFEDVGIVGAKLLFPDTRLQHAGVWLGFRGLVGHAYYKLPANDPGYRSRLKTRHCLECVTGAVMLISDKCWSTVGPWNEKDFAVAYNDVDYCARAHKAGFRIVWTPYSTLKHHESASRSVLKSARDQQRFKGEKLALRTKYDTSSHVDSAFHSGFFRLFSDPTARPFPKRNKHRFWFGNL
jgi:GT2 family glycosyltransferase